MRERQPGPDGFVSEAFTLGASTRLQRHVFYTLQSKTPGQCEGEGSCCTRYQIRTNVYSILSAFDGL